MEKNMPGTAEASSLDLSDLDVESFEFSADSEGGLESLRMGHGLTEVGASCCCSTSSCSCST
ncbi:thiomuracin/GE37468 family thiazolyl RiPP peptide [Streptomyces huasconensis]|uniref:Thiomuracin/GE37468 family thiazolyl RiPP peptide n=1 Tax=Streptomyces huasconensis TaxID=1854574 RepID=A0ABV3LY15_9ACTN